MPDPGNRHVTDAELAAAGVDATTDQQHLAPRLDLARGDLYLFPDLDHVGEVVVQSGGARVGSIAADRLGGDNGEELHRVVTEIEDAGLVTEVETLVQPTNQ